MDFGKCWATLVATLPRRSFTIAGRWEAPSTSKSMSIGDARLCMMDPAITLIRDIDQKRLECRVRKRKIERCLHHERDAKEHVIVTGEDLRPVKCARTDFDRDRANYTNRIKAGQRVEVCRKKQHEHWQAGGDEQRP